MLAFFCHEVHLSGLRTAAYSNLGRNLEEQADDLVRVAIVSAMDLYGSLGEYPHTEIFSW